MDAILYPYKVTVILVNYNGKRFLKDCIESIKNQTYTNISILIVDNCSADKSVDFIKTEYPEIEVITCAENNGFAKGNNIGIKAAIKGGADYVLLLNVDTVIDESLVENLVSEANQSAVTVPQIYSNKKMSKIWYAGGELDYINGTAYHICRTSNNKICKVSFACGCCLLLYKDIIKQVGLFDEKFYLYFEDTDLSIRLRHNNIDIKYVPKAKMWHRIGGSSGKSGKYITSYYVTRNQLYFISKYQNEMHINIFTKVCEIFKRNILTEKDRRMRKYVWWGIWDYYRKNMFKLQHYEK